tara:strand:+ start:525 stop:740 length:216 start_codon:yes stop_codon:yes gene_type:complete
MQHLIDLKIKLNVAQDRYAEASAYSDWSKSVAAYKASETKARAKLIDACKVYLGTDDQQQIINLLHKLETV